MKKKKFLFGYIYQKVIICYMYLSFHSLQHGKKKINCKISVFKLISEIFPVVKF